MKLITFLTLIAAMISLSAHATVTGTASLELGNRFLEVQEEDGVYVSGRGNFIPNPGQVDSIILSKDDDGFWSGSANGNYWSLHNDRGHVNDGRPGWGDIEFKADGTFSGTFSSPSGGSRMDGILSDDVIEIQSTIDGRGVRFAKTREGLYMTENFDRLYVSGSFAHMDPVLFVIVFGTGITRNQY